MIGKEFLMKHILFLSLLLGLAACNGDVQDMERGEQGYREEMEDVTAPNDYTEGTDVKDVPTRPD